MLSNVSSFSVALLAGCTFATAQQTTQPELEGRLNESHVDRQRNRERLGRTRTAILHIGFDTQPEMQNRRTPTEPALLTPIISAIKQAGIPEDSIQSQSQYLESRLVQAAQIQAQPAMDRESAARARRRDSRYRRHSSATDSGQIDWTVKDEKALEAQALDEAASRARQNGEVLGQRHGSAPGHSDLRLKPDVISGAAPGHV